MVLMKLDRIPSLQKYNSFRIIAVSGINQASDLLLTKDD